MPAPLSPLTLDRLPVRRSSLRRLALPRAPAAPVGGLAPMGESDAAVTGGAVSAAAQLSGIRGPDVASHQHPGGYVINWSRTEAAGAKFAFVKATEGRTYTNPYFASDFASVVSVGMVRGAYHFARPKKGA